MGEVDIAAVYISLLCNLAVYETQFKKLFCFLLHFLSQKNLYLFIFVTIFHQILQRKLICKENGCNIDMEILILGHTQFECASQHFTIGK